ncbi:MAG: bifunctional oligoribonuclease/PAP phosphatase NrnA [Clostridia bacterium]|nr:bifunctional oligoribonuclease/PAP phosphatase NrnA [Clostridia bacterium]
MNKTTDRSLATLAQCMKNDDHFLILTHRRPDGDTVGSAVALCIALRKLGKHAGIYPNPEISDRLARYMRPYLIDSDAVVENVVTVDIPSYGQMEQSSKVYTDRLDYVIDHHLANQMTARKAKFADPGAAAAGEIIYRLIAELDVELDAEIAKYLYISISTDTGCFMYSNTTAETHEIIADCMRTGMDAAALNKEFFESKRRQRVEIECLVYNGLRFYDDGKIATITVTQKMRNDTGATEDDIDDFSSIPRKIEGVLAGISAYEQPDGSTKISVRTSGEVDASLVCAAFGGGGHACASGCSLQEAPQEALDAVIAEVRKHLAAIGQ